MQLERDRLETEVERRTLDLTELARHLQTVREDERSRLARELHDELGGLLTAAKLDVARVKSRLKGAAPEIGERIGHLVQSLDAGIALKRRIIEDLRPSTLSNLGLNAALEVLCADFSRRTEVKVQAELDDVSLPEDAQLTAYRVVQEALTNVAKYAKAQHVTVRLHSDGEVARLSVRDDGAGFDTRGVPMRARGLAGMRFRVGLARRQARPHVAAGPRHDDRGAAAADASPCQRTASRPAPDRAGGPDRGPSCRRCPTPRRVDRRSCGIDGCVYRFVIR